MARIQRKFTLAIVAMVLSAVSGLAIAADADAIKYRRTVMKGVGAHMGAMGQIMKGMAPHKAHLAAHARSLEATVNLTADAFKAKTSGGDTTALDKVWSDWDGFMAKAKDSSKAANVLVRTIENDGDVGAAMKALGKTCGGCHKPYRKKKKK